MAAEWRDRALEHSHVLVLADGSIELTTPPTPSIFIYYLYFYLHIVLCLLYYVCSKADSSNFN